jgi:hypothetical protein
VVRGKLGLFVIRHPGQDFARSGDDEVKHFQQLDGISISLAIPVRHVHELWVLLVVLPVCVEAHG